MSDQESLLALTADIVAAHVANNNVATADIPTLITSVHSALGKLGAPTVEPEPEFVPATTARKSLSSPAKIISMIDGKPYSMLKRHLAQNGLTPAEYRIRYNLPGDYPMTAPAYSEQRKALAVKIGLGRKRKVVEAAPVKAAASTAARAKTTTNAVPAKSPAARKPRAAKAVAA